MKKRSIAKHIKNCCHDGDEEDFMNPDKKRKASPSSLFSNLPDEIIRIILSFLDWKTILIRMSLVSKQFFEQSTYKVPLHIKIKDCHEEFFQYENHRQFPSIKSIKICNAISNETDFGYLFAYFIRNCGANHLTKLTIVGCCWKDKDCEIFNYTCLSNLRKLDLSRNQITDQGVESICKSQSMNNLESLDLSFNRGICNFIKSRKPITITKLRKLKLKDNFIEDYSELFSNLPNLTFLKVHGNQRLRLETLKSIFDSLTNLKVLNLSYVNNLTDQVFKQVIENENCKNLTNLNFSSTFSNEGCIYLANAQYLTNITKLSLDMNKITDNTCQVLSKSYNLSSLTNLSLFGNSIGDGGFQSILENLKELNFLNLGSNMITDQGILYLIKNGIKKLKRLSLYRNHYSVRRREDFFRKFSVDRANFFLTGVESQLIHEKSTQKTKEEYGSPSYDSECRESNDRILISIPLNVWKTNQSIVVMDIPPEIMFHIFTYLDWKTIIRGVSKLSHFWANEINRIPLQVEILKKNEFSISPTNFNGFTFNIQSLEIRGVHMKSHSYFDSLPWISQNEAIFSKMERLILCSCHLDDFMCSRLCKNITSNSLLELDLSRNQITDKGANIIFTLLNNRKMEILNLSYNRIRNISTLGQYSVINLKSLNLAHNKIINISDICSKFSQLEKLKLNGNDNISELCFLNVQKISTLTYLNFSSCKSFTDDYCCKYFTGAVHSNLRTLKISSDIGDDGCLEIAGCEQLKHLKSLTLDMCNISDNGCTYIANSFIFENLTYLSLYGNQISDDGFINILESSFLYKNLRELNLGANQIGVEAVAFMLEKGLNNLDSMKILDIDCPKDLLDNVKLMFKEKISISTRPLTDDEDSDESDSYNVY